MLHNIIRLPSYEAVICFLATRWLIHTSKRVEVQTVRAWHYSAIVAFHGVGALSTVAAAIVVPPHAGVTTQVTADIHLVLWRKQTKLSQWLSIVTRDASVSHTDIRMTREAAV